MPVSISCIVWLWMFETNFGLVNAILRASGIIKENIAWFSYPSTAILTIITADVWMGTPFFGVAFLAGLQTIPKELYEAAEIDGAGSLTKFLLITLPQLRYVVFIVTLFSTIWTFAMFETAFIITRGGPINSTHLFSTLTYQIGIALGRLGEGTAISLFMFPILIVLMYLELRYVRKGA